jgi:hypothetical protein
MAYAEASTGRMCSTRAYIYSDRQMQIDAIYHTSIVVGGVEHFYGGGIQEAVPGHTPYGQPIQLLDLGWVAGACSFT